MIARAVMGERLVPIVFFSPIRVEYELVQKMCWLVGLHLIFQIFAQSFNRLATAADD